MAVFEGAGVALITPFKENGEVNYDKLEEIVEEQIAGGTDAIIACGTTGEASTMTHEEHLDVIGFICDVTKKRIPVVAGTGSNCTQTAIYLSKEAEERGRRYPGCISLLQQGDPEGTQGSFYCCGRRSKNTHDPLQYSRKNRCKYPA